MKKWHPQRYKQNALQLKRNTEITKNALRIGDKVNCNKALPIFTLAHLSKQSGIDSTILDKLVQRREIDPNTPIYRVFSIKKRTTSEKRYICVPCHELKTVQRFIHEKILLQLESHQAVTSYKSDCTIYEAAKHHCSSKWMIKLDLKDFFDSISEVSVYRVFRKVGYSALLSFQMARLCTRVIPKLESNTTSLVNENKKYSLNKYSNSLKGRLPQGAPTSPLLSNLAVHKMDRDIEALSDEYNMIYTRYADDLIISTSTPNMTRAICEKVVHRIYSIVTFHGFEPNKAKTKIIPPGARKVVLGLVVNGNEPKLSKTFKSNLLQHLHFCNKENVGAVVHARHKKFDSVVGFKNHLKGLISHAIQIDTKFGNQALTQFRKIQWPL